MTSDKKINLRPAPIPPEIIFVNKTPFKRRPKALRSAKELFEDQRERAVIEWALERN